MAYSRLRRNSAQRKALLRDLVTDLILNGRIETTETKAKELKKLADKMVTLGKTTGSDEKKLHARRQAASFIRFEKAEDGQYAVQKLWLGDNKIFEKNLNAYICCNTQEAEYYE